MLNLFQPTNLLINIISPNKFNEGGAAILDLLSKNHHKLIEGIKLISPLFKNNLRLLIRSYEILAKQKSPEEQRPCANIITNAPHIPQ